MKNLFMQKILPFLLNWFRTRFTRRSDKKYKFSGKKSKKQFSPKHIHLLKIAHIFKSNLRQKV